MKALVRQKSCWKHPVLVAESLSSAAVSWGGWGVFFWNPPFATAAQVCRGRSDPAEFSTCQHLHRRPESVASVCCSSVVSEASLVFYYRQKEQNGVFYHLQTNEQVHENEWKAFRMECAWWPQGGSRWPPEYVLVWSGFRVVGLQAALHHFPVHSPAGVFFCCWLQVHYHTGDLSPPGRDAASWENRHVRCLGLNQCQAQRAEVRPDYVIRVSKWGGGAGASGPAAEGCCSRASDRSSSCCGSCSCCCNSRCSSFWQAGHT